MTDGSIAIENDRGCSLINHSYCPDNRGGPIAIAICCGVNNRVSTEHIRVHITKAICDNVHSRIWIRPGVSCCRSSVRVIVANRVIHGTRSQERNVRSTIGPCQATSGTRSTCA